LPPADVPHHPLVAGSAAAWISAGDTVSIAPDARNIYLLPEDLLRRPATALYGRAPDAKPNP
jgi:hypothetical protein